MDLRSALSWTQETTLSSFFPLAALPCWWVLRQPCSSQLGRSRVIQKPEPWRSWGDKAPARGSRSQVWRRNILCPQLRAGLGAPCGPPEQSGQHRAHRPQRAHPEPALLWALRLETQTEMEPNTSSNHQSLFKNHMEWNEHKHKLCNLHHNSI